MSSIAAAVLQHKCGRTPHSVVATPTGCGGGYDVSVWCTQSPESHGEKKLVASSPDRDTAALVGHAVAEALGDLPITIM